MTPPARPVRPAAPAPPAKPVKPVARAAATVPPEATAGFDGLEKSFFASGTAHKQNPAIALTSDFGYFLAYEYDNQGNPADKHVAIFFYNKRSKQTWEIHGTIARKYLALLPAHTKVVDFPITNEMQAQANAADRISCLSKYTLIWNHATNDVEQRVYNTWVPSKQDVFIAGTEEYATGMKDIDYKNWRGEPVAYYQSSREMRPAGLPSQVLLHETATLGNMAFGNIRKDGNTVLVPHFCVNNIDDKTRRGNILQFADIVEYTSHGPPMNGRAVGIEFVNPVIESFDNNKKPVFNLDKSTKGIYLKTVLGGIPRLFIPMEFYPSDDKTAFSLTIPAADLINMAALTAMEVGPKKEKTVTLKSGVVTLQGCRSDKFENLLALVPLLTRSGKLGGLNLIDIGSYKNIHLDAGKKLFIYQPAWINVKGVHHYGVDVRLPGIYSHGMVGVGRRDGHAQALYLYFRTVCGFAANVTMQKIIDLLVAGKGAKRTPIELDEKVTVTPGVGENDPKRPIKIKVTDCLDITGASTPPAPAAP